MKWLLLTLLTLSASADYRFHPSILDAIKECECDKISGQCHPYTIRLNRAHDINTSRANGFVVRNRLLRFEKLSDAVEAAKKLISLGCTSMDLGAYQINYHYHPDEDIARYFDEARARRFAEEILSELVERHGYSWETLGRYHSGTADLNRGYYLRLHKYIYGSKR